MNFGEIRVGRVYGMAAGARRKPAEKPVRVKALDRLDHKEWRKRRVKVRHVEGRTEGLEEWISSSRILAEWGKVKAIPRDEERAQRLSELAQGFDGVVEDAVDIVLQSTGEEGLHSPYDGALSIPASGIGGLQRMAERAGFNETVEVRAVQDAFVDRHGTAHYPIAFIARVARAFAAVEPEAVTRHIELEEEELKAKGYLPGESFSHLWLEKRQPAFSLARSWAGFENELKALRSQIERLARICEIAALALDSAGQESEARRVRRAVKGL